MEGCVPIGAVESPNSFGSDLAWCFDGVGSLIDESKAKAVRDPPAGNVRDVMVDLDELDAGDRQSSRDETLSGVCRDSLSQRCGSGPVSDLETVWPDTPVKATTADELLITKDPVVEVLATVPLIDPFANQLLSSRQLERLELRPRHPRPKVFNARGDGFVELSCIVQRVSTNEDPSPTDLIGRTGGEHDQQYVDAVDRTPREFAAIIAGDRKQPSQSNTDHLVEHRRAVLVLTGQGLELGDIERGTLDDRSCLITAVDRDRRVGT